MKKAFAVFLSLLFVLTGAVPVFAKSDYTVKISPDNEKYDISDMLYGAFIEDISYACDGGLVSNLVNNNSFEYFFNREANWLFDNCEYELTRDYPLNDNNKYSCLITVDGEATVTNIGFPEYYEYKTYDVNKEKAFTPDMGFKEGEEYELSLYVKNIDFSGDVKAKLDDVSEEKTLDTEKCKNWTKLTLTLKSNKTEDGSLKFIFNGKGKIAIDFVTLVPKSSHGYGDEKWKYVTLRSDLYQAIEDMSPKFIRFPGGCLCEGVDLSNLYDWKETIGPVEERENDINLWRDDWNGRQYINTNSMGYHEFFQLCADVGAEPVPILNVALTCQGRNDYGGRKWAYVNGEITEEEFNQYLETIALTPGTKEFDAYVQDILDLIEYANGDETTVWGKKRIENGSKEPFNLKYIGLGNENVGEVYFRNFDALYKAIKEKYPEITIISSAGGWLEGDDYDDAWSIINDKYADTVVDEHYYTKESYLFYNNERYDNFDRNGAKVFVGEYAATSDGYGTLQTKSNIWEAVEEAGFLTGFERNGDVVAMSSYAPTFAKVNSQCWDINLIWFDSQYAVLSPSYFVQLLFANNTGNRYIKTDLGNGKTFIEKELYESVTVDEDSQTIYVKLVNASGKNRTVNLDLMGYKVNKASNMYLSEDYKGACNEVGKTYVVPHEKELKAGNNVQVKMGKYSVNVIRIAYGDNDGSSFYTLPDTVPESMGKFVPIAVKAGILGGIGALILLVLIVILIIKLIKKRRNKKAKEIEDVKE
jgi:alpha-N-arabinofuranosidase